MAAPKFKQVGTWATKTGKGETVEFSITPVWNVSGTQVYW